MQIANIDSYKNRTLRFSQYANPETLDNWLIFFHNKYNPKKRKPSKINNYTNQIFLPPHNGPQSLLDYQTEVIDDVYNQIISNKSALLSLPTGAGKTITALSLAIKAIESNFDRILWLAPQKLLLNQAQSELQKLWWSNKRSSTIESRILQSSGAKFWFTTNASHSIIFQTLQLSLKDPDLSKYSDLVFVDEAHHIVDNQFGKIVDSISSSKIPIIGLTATPGRSVSSEVSDHVKRFSSNLITPSSLGSDPITSLQKKGVYSNITFETLSINSYTDLDLLITHKKATNAQIASYSPGRLDSIVDYICNTHHQSIIVFANSYTHCHVIASALYLHDISIDIVSSYHNDEYNKHAIENFKSCNIKVLINVKYLTIGADIPTATCVIFSIPSSSPIFFEQVIGRVCRGPTVGGTSHATVIDFDNHINYFGHISSYARFANYW